MSSTFRIAVVSNVAIILTYIFLYSSEVMTLMKQLGNSVGFPIWTPFGIWIGFGSTFQTSEGTIAADGMAHIYNVSFLAVVAMAIFNLLMIRRLEKRRHL